MTVTVLALRDFYYHGEDIVAGQPVTMIPIDAAVEARAGNVSLDKQLPTYQRRDMVAQPIVDEIHVSTSRVFFDKLNEKPQVVKRRRTRRKKVIA